MIESFKIIQFATFWVTHCKMRYSLTISFLTYVLPCFAKHSNHNYNPIPSYEKLSFRIEASEFSIISTITSKLIDDAISHGFSIQSAAVSQFPKSLKIHKLIYKTIVKAQNCKTKYLLVSGNEKHKQRNVLSEVRDFAGSIIGNTFGK